MRIKRLLQIERDVLMASLLCLLPFFANAQPMNDQADGKRYVPCMNGSGKDQIWWGYFTDDEVNKLTFDGYLGFGQATSIDAAICIPAGHPIAGGGTIKAVRFWLGDNLSNINSDVTLWISNDLPDNISKAAYTQTIARSSLSMRLNEIELTTPYRIKNDWCFIGYSFSINGPSFPIMGGGEDAEYSLYYRYTGSNWLDFYGEGYGKLAMQVLLDGVVLRSNSATPSDFGTHYVLKGTEANVPVEIINFGKEPINSISYTISTNGNVSEEKQIKLNGLKFNNSTKVNIPFPADNEAMRYDKKLTITKVNGVANEASKNSSSGSLITLSEKSTPTPVVEEFTGTWCGWCTIGYDGMEKTKETFGDQVVLIAVHNKDPMEISDYNPVSKWVSSYPNSLINRSIEAYPSAGTLNTYINQCLRDLTVGEVKAVAAWADDAKTAIEIETETKFFYTDYDGRYGIAFVLIEDGMTGTGSGWAQTNYLSGNRNYANSYPFWYNSPSSVTGVKFNHVAVAAWEIAAGVDGSVSYDITAGDIQKFSYKVNINSKNIIQDKSKIKIAALLIDRASGGAIINACETAILDYDPSAIEGIHASDIKETERYTLDGRKVNAPFPGLNIIKMSDGSIRKVIVK